MKALDSYGRSQLLKQAEDLGVKNASRMRKSQLRWHISRETNRLKSAPIALVSSIDKGLEELKKIAKKLRLKGFSRKRKRGLVLMINAALRANKQGD